MCAIDHDVAHHYAVPITWTKYTKRKNKIYIAYIIASKPKGSGYKEVEPWSESGPTTDQY